MTTEIEQEQEQQQDSRDFKRTREAKEAAEERVKDLEAKLLGRTIRDAGLDPNAEIVKMIAERYSGDIEDAAAFAEHAKALGYTTAPAPEQRQQSETEQQIDQLQTRADELRDLGRQADPSGSIREQIAEAEAAGDHAKARALKNRAVLDAR